MNDKEILEQRLNLFEADAWRVLVKELSDMAESVEKITDIEDERTLFQRQGSLGILNMIINLEETTKFTLDQLD